MLGNCTPTARMTCSLTMASCAVDCAHASPGALRRRVGVEPLRALSAKALYLILLEQLGCRLRSARATCSLSRDRWSGADSAASTAKFAFGSSGYDAQALRAAEAGARSRCRGSSTACIHRPHNFGSVLPAFGST